MRADTWLFAARLFKTRQIAIDAINAGRVMVNDERIKPARNIQVGDQMLVRKPPYEWSIVIQRLAAKRGAATIAQAMYTETPESAARREALQCERKSLPPSLFAGRPTKQDRRKLDQFNARQVSREDSSA